MSEQEIEKIKDVVQRIARDSASRGPGWAQEAVVLRAVRDEIRGQQSGNLNLQVEQEIVNAWHDLFLQKVLAWGYDLDNPSSPFFHVRQSA